MNFSAPGRPAREPVLNAPAIVLWLIGIILVLHVGRVALPGDWPDRLIADYALIPERFAQSVQAGWPSPGTLLTLLTYIFLHGDFTHVGVNSLWLLAFGPVVARRLGGTRFLLYFFLCGLAAALVHLAVYWGSPGAVIGASGGVSGLMGGAMRIVYGRLYGGPNQPGGRDGLAAIFSKPILGFSAVWITVNIVSGIFRIGVSDDLTLIAWVAHLGGYFAGLLTIGLFDPFARARGRIGTP